MAQRHKSVEPLFPISEQELDIIRSFSKGLLPFIDPYGDMILYPDHIRYIQDHIVKQLDNKESCFCYDKEYYALKNLQKNFYKLVKDSAILLLGD